MKSTIGASGWKFGGILLVWALISWSASTWAGAGEVLQVSLGGAVTVPAVNVGKLAVADPAVADVLPLSEKEISVIGKKAGETTLTVVFTDNQATKMYRVVVGNDPAATTIREMVGIPGMTVRAVGDALVLDGQVENELQSQRAEQVAKAFKPQVVNLLEVKNPRQIKIRVRVAEVNVTAAKKMGLKWWGDAGQVQYGFNFSGQDGTINPITHGFMAQIPNAGGVGGFGELVSADVVLQLLQSKGFARLLSEPTLITRSGTEASFLAGQEVPIVQTLNNVSSVTYKEVGVRMVIKPVADSQNRINTTIHAEVSSISAGIVQGGSVAANSLPVITTRKSDTVLQLADGQTLVLGGLLSNDVDTDTLRKFPWLADIPIIGALFRHNDRSQVQRELVFFMTPEIVKDPDAETAGAIRTPALKKWNTEGLQGVLPEESPKDKWGLHDLQTLGLPENKPATPDKADPTKGATQNFAPARPATGK